MSWVDQTLDEYGKALGLESLTFNDQGVASLQFEEMGALFIERLEDPEAGDAVLIYLVNEIERPTSGVYAQALEICHWDQNSPFLVNAALRQDRYLSFSVRLAEADFTLPTMERVVGLLDQFQKQALEGAAA